MRFSALTRLLTLTAAAGALSSEAGAQASGGGIAVRPSIAPEARVFSFGSDGPRAALGLTTGTSGSKRDTLGLLVNTIVAGGPADRAGIEEGNRLQSINGVSLRVSAADAEDWEASSFLTRRLTRELTKLKPGDEAELRVYGGGQTRTIRVRTADADTLYRRSTVSRSATTAEARRRELDDRPTLGISLGSSGSNRDTLGVLVMGVSDEGPAAKAGIEEGNRIAAIDGVNLRVSRDDLGDAVIASSRARRLTREIAAKKPGDEVELRVYGNGQTRTVRVRLARAGDLPRSRGGTFIFGDGMSTIIAPSVIAPEMRYEIERLRDIGPMIRGTVRTQLHDLEPRIRENAERALEGAGRGLRGLELDLHDLHERDLPRIGDEIERALEGLRFELRPDRELLRAPVRSLAPTTPAAPRAPARVSVFSM